MATTYTFGPVAWQGPAQFARADLELYGVNHFRPSFTARVFLNDPDPADTTPPTYAGSFSIFGHQTCVGDEGHCEIPSIAFRRFDDRPSNPLTRAFKRVVITDALRFCLTTRDTITITIVVAVDPTTDMDFEGELLDIQGMQLTAFT